MESGVDPDSPRTRDERFEFGLDCVLDGIVTRIHAGDRDSIVKLVEAQLHRPGP